jgi:phage/plasmid-like protein (TIGR03299 family)
MAHNLEIRNGEASLFYVDEPPWHGLGRKLAAPATAQKAIEAAKLDWEVMKVPLYAERGSARISVEDRFGVVRKDLWPGQKCKVLGIVGSQYTPLQNVEAFTFFDPIVGRDAAVYHTAGVLDNGERIWILAKLPDHIRVAGNDIVDKYLLLSNSHDGTSSVQVKFTPIRVVCENTLTMALSEGRTVRVAHTRHLHDRLRRAERLLGIVHARFSDIEEAFTVMAKVQMGNGRLQEYLKLVYPDPKDPEDEKARKRVNVSRGWAEYFFTNGKGNGQERVKGTLWAAYNGVTELVDHQQTQQTPERRLDSMWFGTGYGIKARAFSVAQEKAKVWLN